MNAAAPDVELVSRAKAGEIAAFEAFATRHEQRIYTLSASFKIPKTPRT